MNDIYSVYQNPMSDNIYLEVIHMAEILEHDHNFASRGVGNAGLTLGIIGSALGLLNGNNGNGMGLNLFGGNGNTTRALDDRIDSLQTELAKEKSERYTDQKFCELKSDMYNRFDMVNAKFDGVNASLCAQNTWNATNTANLNCINSQINQLTSLLTYGVASDKVLSSSSTTTT